MRHQSNYPHHNEESQFLHDLGDYMTNGNYSIVYRLWFIFMNANSMLLMVILNKNMGLKVAKQSESLFALIWLVVLFYISLHSLDTAAANGTTEETLSAPIIYFHGMLFVILAVWRKVGAWWNMRNSGRKGFRRRLDYGIGDSVVYPVIRWILRPLGLVDNEVTPKTFWKMTEDRWMQWWQPLILVIAGLLISNAGYEVYGNFLVFATLCYFYTTFRAFDNSAKIRQAQVDADIYGDMITPESDHSDIPHTIS